VVVVNEQGHESVRCGKNKKAVGSAWDRMGGSLNCSPYHLIPSIFPI